MIDFSAGAGKDGPQNLIPNGQLAFAIMTVRGVKASKSGGQYLDIELTIDDGQPYARKKLWDMIGDPQHPGNSPEYREMGMRSIARILEAGRNAGPSNPAAYSIGGYTDLSGLRVAIKIGVEKGRDGYEDKNRITEYLTPNPQSSAHKDFQRLLAGEYNKAAPAAATTGFGAAPAGGFGSPQPSAQPAPVAQGWGQPAAQQGGGFAQPGFQQTNAPTAGNQWAADSSGAATVTMTSPSDAPNWIQQAQG
jgi:hypothetical protein